MLVYVGFNNSPSVADSAANNKVVSPNVLRLSAASVSTTADPSIELNAFPVGEASRKLVLQPGERRGWWSKHRYDRRTRMTSTVLGSVDDRPAKILLDSGANVSILATSFARKLGLLKHAHTNTNLQVQGISNEALQMAGKIKIKITLMQTIVYFYEVWISDHHAGVDLLLGVDFLMSAGIRLDLYSGRAILPDEIRVPLLNIKDARENNSARRIMVGPVEDLTIAPGLSLIHI